MELKESRYYSPIAKILIKKGFKPRTFTKKGNVLLVHKKAKEMRLQRIGNKGNPLVKQVSLCELLNKIF